MIAARTVCALCAGTHLDRDCRLAPAIIALIDDQDDPTDPRHGTPNGYYNLKCRCLACRAAKAAYVRRWRARRRTQKAEAA